MRSTRNFISFITLVILVIAVVGLLIARQSITPSPSPSSIPTSKPSPSGISPGTTLGSSTGICHATLLDPTDNQSYVPDPSCTPGVIDPAVTQENLFETVCKSGYTATVRPPVSYTNTLKKQQIEDYSYADNSMHDYEEDHFISLELGGSPKDPKNLWPEPHASLNEKDKVENYLHSQLCAGSITLAQAQEAVSKKWYEVYKQIK
jgi:hypothetical protein